MQTSVERDSEDRAGERDATVSGFSFRKLFSDLAVYSSGTLLIKGMSIISAPIFTRLFDPDQYGAWSFINVAVAFLTGILMLGGDNAYTRYFFRCRTEEEKQTLTTTWFTFLAVWSVVVIAVTLPFSRTLAGWVLGTDQYRSAMVIGFLSAPPAMINLILSQVLRNRFQARTFATLNVMTAALTLILAVFFVLTFEMGVTGALLGAASAAVLMIPVRLWLVRDLLRFRFSMTFLKQLLMFGLPLVPMNIAFWLLSNADRIMLARLASLEAVGLYSIAASMAAVLMLLQNAVGQSWLPHAIKVYEEENRRAEAIVSRTMVYFLAGSAVIVTGFTALAQEVIFILVPPVYYGAFAAIPFLAIGFHFFTTAHVSVVGIMVKDKTVYIMISCWLVAVINIGLNTLLIPRFGIAGAAAATGSAYMLFALGYAIASWKIWPVHYPGMTVAALLAIPPVAVGLIAMIALNGPDPVINFLLKMVVLVAVLTVVMLIISRSEGVSIREAWKMIKKRDPGY